ncbi:hypothetical protein NQ176_g10522 [Zarea fungicola]|uniref:Uncharacterized protein n=1 Tax=Zarea fungicola TaxID=93591 RepID=A0ACC1MF40_9HYPO|nr:hypothetical protein NQ176_g10522 [Lecanicillium fungicola]
MSVQVHGPTFVNSTLVGFVVEPDGRDESPSEYSYRYLKWSILGVFGPELVIWAAWRQYISARSLTNFIHEHGKISNDILAQQWTMVHSFYAGMGGFVFDLSESNAEKGSRFIQNHKRLHVTPRGIQMLAKCGMLPHIAASDITDKSKTDGSGKVICCIQVSWMVIQAITRAAAGLPVTPLETNTIGHVVCALINYLLWWHKPRWIKEPTVLRGQWVEAVCAFMYMSSQVSAENRTDRDLLRDFGTKAEMSSVLYLPGDNDDAYEKCNNSPLQTLH